MDTFVHIGHKVVQDDAVVYNGFLVCFHRGDLLTGASSIHWGLIYPGSMSGWMSFMDQYIPRRLIFDWDITRSETENRILTGLLSGPIMSSWSYQWG
jgi:hypothetical protein